MFWIKKLLSNVAALAFGLLVAFVILEIFLRVYNPFYQRVQLGKIVLPIKQEYRIKPNRAGLDPEVIHKKNSLGFLGEEFPADPASRQLLLFVGGSTTECRLLSNGKTWPELTYDCLKPQLPSLWANNAGLDGQSTFGHQLLLDEYLIQLKPKCIVFLIGVNDIKRNDPKDHDNELLKGQTPHHQNGAIRVVRRLGRYSVTVETIYNFLHHARQIDGMNREHVYDFDLKALPNVPLDTASLKAELATHAAGTFLPAYRQRIEQLLITCKSNNITPILATQPLLLGYGVDSITSVDLATVELQTSPKMSGALYWQLLEQYNDITRSVGAANNVQVIDLASELPKDSRYFYDIMHFTNAGADAIGQIMCKHLAPALQQTQPDSISTPTP